MNHLRAWVPSIAKSGIHDERELEAIGGGTLSFETDAELAPRIVNSFMRAVREYCKKWKRPNLYADIHTRAKTGVFAKFLNDACEEGVHAEELVYDDDGASKVLEDS